MIPGSKGQKTDASLLARGFLTLGARSAEQSGIIGVKRPFAPNI